MDKIIVQTIPAHQSVHTSLYIEETHKVFVGGKHVQNFTGWIGFGYLTWFLQGYKEAKGEKNVTVMYTEEQDVLKIFEMF